VVKIAAEAVCADKRPSASAITYLTPDPVVKEDIATLPVIVSPEPETIKLPVITAEPEKGNPDPPKL
jgi:hypothetical protein